MPTIPEKPHINIFNLDYYLYGAGVPLSRMGNNHLVTDGALKAVLNLYQIGKVKFKVDSQKRLKAYASDFIPKVGRPKKGEAPAELAA